MSSTNRPNHHLIIALLVGFAYHLGLTFFTFKRTYDAYVHIFFADHYARSWFEPWEPRWYTGFNMTSYPPASHQVTALLSSLLGLQNAFIVVLVCALLFTVVGIYRFAKIWVSAEAAGYAALIAIFATGITETAHVFGQLPTLFSLGFLLNALPYVYRWVHDGRWRILFVAWMVCAATTAGHHVTTLFGSVFFVAPVLVVALWDRYAAQTTINETPILTIVVRFLTSWLTVAPVRRAFLRAIVFGVGLIAILVAVVLPYWLWSASDPISQVPIPHASRDSFIENQAAGLVFWLIPYGVGVLFLPWVTKQMTTLRRLPLLLSFLLLILLGTGGTTPIPRLLLGGAFEILTLDRFTFWATIVMLPFMGEIIASVAEGQIGRKTLSPSAARACLLVFAVALISASVFTANLTQFRKFQPEPIAMEPILQFLKKDEHDAWRFLTLGFGDQMAWLSAQTDALSVEGNYHSARRLPELTSSPVERLDGAKFRGIPGLGSLQQFLTVPEKYHLKFIFSNDPFYDPLLYFSGWREVGRLDNNIIVWERAGIPPLPDTLPNKQLPQWQRIMWGVLPLTTIGLAIAAVFLLGQQADRPRWWSWRMGAFVLVGAAGLILTWAGVRRVQNNGISAESTLLAYYDALDFRQFEEAYSLLDPDTRPDYEIYLEHITSQGGLRGSYAKLDNLVTVVLEETAATQTIRADAEWVTALAKITSAETHLLSRSAAGWVVAPPAITENPISTTSQQPINVRTVSAQSINRDGRHHLLGVIANETQTAADITITGILYDATGAEIGRNNAHTLVVHTLAAGEATPFRIPFPTSITQTVGSFEIKTQAYTVVEPPYTVSFAADDGLQATADGQPLLVGNIINAGCRDVSIVQLLIAQQDAAGNVLWVEQFFVQAPLKAGDTRYLAAQVSVVADNPTWWVTSQSFVLAQKPRC